MVMKLKAFEVSKHLESDEAIEVFMRDAFETQDAVYIIECIGVVARAKEGEQNLNKMGLAREHLYRSFVKNENPSFKSTLEVLSSLGIQLKPSVVRS